MTRPQPGFLRVAARGWYVFVPVIVGYAVVQFVLILPGVTPAPSPVFVGLVILSYVLDVALVSVIAVAASAGARNMPLRAALREGGWRRRVEVIAWSALWVFVISLAGVSSAILSGVVVLVAAATLPQMVAGRGVRSWLRPLRWIPWRTILWGALSFAALAAGGVADAESGFLIGEPVAAPLARLLGGVINILILCAASVLVERAEAARAARMRAEPTPEIASATTSA